MAKINIKESKIYVRSTIFYPSKDKFGDNEEAVCYNVIVERLDGHRLEHQRVFYGVLSGQTEKGYPIYTDVNRQALSDAKQLACDIENVGVIDDVYWNEIDSRYGSEYYKNSIKRLI